ncbi:cadherin-related family member 2 [Anguilla anguilla]|uniref:cadherin-related family member 2 n=1 Tax=Anguilla anguilla TaxID=7936 RepID=UPI0015AE8728|nr:cadherin-related family member 2 [Anguilla anguilla]
MLLVRLLILAPMLAGYVQGFPEINTIEARVLEDVPPGDFAFQVEATDTNGAPLTYKFVTTGEFGEGASYFKIDANTGRVTVLRELDRETKPVIRVQVEVSSGEIDRAVIPVIVEDANDNWPVFQNGPFNEEVPENTAVDTVLFRAIATDADFNTAAAVTYSISKAIPEEGLSLFSIFPSTGEVKLMGKLDFSKSSFYQLEINATDGGGPFEGQTVFRWTTTGAFIKVKDVPDLDPQFLRLPYSAIVNEHATIGHSVFQVQAFDPDTEVRDIILYSISNSSAPELFSIDQSSGIISVSSVLDRESLLDIDATVILQVVARESNLNVNGIQASSSAEVEIRILDINDNKPLFYACNADPCDFTTVAHSFSGNVDEESSRGVTVAGLNMGVKDLDEGANAVFTLHLEGPDKDAFSVTPLPLTGFVQISIERPRDVDYEKKKIMTVQVVATDASIPENCCSTATVTIQINDINDNTPAFKNESYRLEVKEHSAVGTVIATITATDPDTEDEGKLIYSLASGSILQYFTVDPKNGSVMVNSENIDREIRSSYTATLQASDTAGRMGFTTLEITILDINDHAPVIMRDKYEEFIKEGPGKKLEIQIQARDDDEEGTDNSRICYEIMPSEFSPNFTIDKNTGKLENIGPLDREAIDPSANGVIELNVTVYDMGVPSLSSQVTVLINVEDINDNTPQFRQKNYLFYVKESIKGAFVGSVSAYDADQAVFNNRISFDITSGGLASFTIVSLEEGDGKGYMGNISVDQDIALDYEQRKEPYVFKVEARDEGRNKDEAWVEVRVLDVNDERPIFPSGQSVRVNENTNETVVGTIVGKDLDGNHSLTYELLSAECRCEGVMGPCQEDWFNLLPTGEVTVNPEFAVDYEKCDQVILDAQVVDIFTEKGPNNSLAGQLQIDIVDMNDNVPQFIISEALFIVVNEKTEKGTSVAVVTATDLDSGKNKEITFSVLTTEFISSDNEISKESLFYVDTVAEQDAYVGTIKTIGSLASDRKGKYLVTVEAANIAVEPQLKNSTQLEIYTIDSSFRVELYFESSVDQINDNINEIRRTLSSATKATVHILRTAAVSSAQRATALTLLEAYFVYLNGTAIQSETVEKVLQEDLYHANILKDFGLTGIVSGATDPGVVDPVRFILLGLVGGLLIVLVVMITSLVCTQRNYKRKLKASKALNTASMVAEENQKPSTIVPGTNVMKANPVLHLNIDTSTDLGFDEEDSSTDRVSVDSLDYNIDMNMTEKDTMPMIPIKEENEEMEEHVEPLDAALAARGNKKHAPAAPHGFTNPTLDTTDL